MRLIRRSAWQTPTLDHDMALLLVRRRATGQGMEAFMDEQRWRRTERRVAVLAASVVTAGVAVWLLWFAG